MTPPRRPRGRLTEEDLRVWAEVARTAKPLRGKAVPSLAADAVTPPRKDLGRPFASDGETSTGGGMPRKPATKPPATKPPVSGPPLATLERRLLQRLRRGRTAPGAVIDLHGLRQDEARRRLWAFLHDCQARGMKTAIVITGKGGAGNALAGERGVLRRAVPLWLAMPDFRLLVIGFGEAGAGLGGAGALILRIRAARRA